MGTERNDMAVCPMIGGAEPDLGEPPGWEEIIAEVERRLEAMRLGEMERRRGRLRGMSEAQRATVDRLTRDLMRRAVLEGLEETARRGGLAPEEMGRIRDLFPAPAARKSRAASDPSTGRLSGSDRRALVPEPS